MNTTLAPGSQAQKEWDRFNPPVAGVRWCFRNNINYQQSGVLFGMRYVADHRETFLDNFVAKAERLIKRGETESAASGRRTLRARRSLCLEVES